MAAFNPGMPNPNQQPADDTGVVGKWQQLKELQRARLAGYVSGVPDTLTAPTSAGLNPALTAPHAPTMGAPPQPLPARPVATPMAQGRIVTKPTLAVLGESGGPEMVIPLNNDPQNKTSLAAVSHIPRYKRQ